MYKWQIFHRKKESPFQQTHSDDVFSIIALNEIENALLNKKYGLVWEEHSEMWMKLQEHIPVFIEDTTRKITTSDCPAIVQRLSNCPIVQHCPDYEKFNFLIEGIIPFFLKLETHRNKKLMLSIDPPYNTAIKILSMMTIT